MSKNEQLRYMRKVAGLSQFDLAARTKVPRFKISTFESGHEQLKPHEMSRVEEVLQTALQERFDSVMR